MSLGHSIDVESQPRILMVTTSSVTLRAFLLPHAQDLESRGWEVDAAASVQPRDERVLHEAFRSVLDIPWKRQPYAPTNFRAFRRIRHVVRVNQYAIVHVHTPVASLLTRLAVATIPPRHRPLLVYTAHGFHFHDRGSGLANRLYLALERLGGRFTDALIVINEADLLIARRYHLARADAIHWVPGVGIDVGAWSLDDQDRAEGSKLRSQLGISGHARLILVVAELNPGKRHCDVIHALSRLDVDVEVAFAGDGPEGNALRRLAEFVGVIDRVHFLGLRSDVRTLLAAADVMVLASVREGLPRSLMEAMAAGLPIVATDIRGNRDLLGRGEGMLYEVGDVAALAKLVDQVLADPSVAASMSRRARRTVRAFSLDRVLAANWAIYDALVRKA